MRKSRAPNLSDKSIGAIVSMMDDWNGKLTWDLLIARIKATTGIEYSRHTLMSRPRIAAAFNLRQASLRGSLPAVPGSSKDAHIQAALEQVERFKAKVNRLEHENNLLLQQFLTWLYNANSKGLTIEMLNVPLRKPDRDRTPGEE